MEVGTLPHLTISHMGRAKLVLQWWLINAAQGKIWYTEDVIFCFSNILKIVLQVYLEGTLPESSRPLINTSVPRMKARYRLIDKRGQQHRNTGKPGSNVTSRLAHRALAGKTFLQLYPCSFEYDWPGCAIWVRRAAFWFQRSGEHRAVCRRDGFGQ